MLFDVAIVGCGPVGALAANLFGRAGLRTVVLEREGQLHPLPRAVHLDHEMMRLFQGIGLVEQMLPDMRDTDGHLHIGADHGVIRYLGTVGRPRPFGWSNDYFFYQPELEAHLRAGFAACPEVALRTGVELEAITQSATGCALQVRTSAGAEEVQARWVIGCDGARSKVRQLLGVKLDDLDFEEPWLVVDVDAAGPVKFPQLTGVPEVADLQRLSVMLCDPQRPATVVPGRGQHRRWEFMLLPGENDAEMMQPASVARLLQPWLEGVPHEVIRATTYRFHGLVAERWKVGRVFLAGDAAHQTPPFFGQGMCHGLRDVANLAWKLSLVARGTAPESLLDTYQSERDPHVRSVIAAAVAAGRYICQLNPAAATARDAEMRERMKSTAPTTAADLIPALRVGVVANGTPGAGERFIQSRVGQRLLDEVTGSGWRLFVNGQRPEAQWQQLCAETLPGSNLRIVDATALEDGGVVRDWLQQRQVSAVLVRPDFYIFGTTNGDPLGLVRLLAATLQAPLSILEHQAA